ncbi:MAG: hypothetical protein JWM16_5396 [Verrucomicrobiales bacterium]|nr:hypothetical protein [Verrucomicrobiales bacterium]
MKIEANRKVNTGTKVNSARRGIGNSLITSAATGLILFIGFIAQLLPAAELKPDHRYLYVAAPGIRNYLEYGGHGLVVFDLDDGHKFVKRIKTSGLDTQGKPLNVKGVCANAETKRIYITTTRTLTCLDLVTERILWEKPYGFGCDRMALSPDGKIMYLPSLEGPVWYVVNALNGDVITKITPNSGAHNTVYGNDGSHVFLAGLRSPFLTVAETTTHTSNSAVGPFSAPIRPFTVNSKQTLCFVCINELLGFEVGDIKSGKKLFRVEVEGFQKGEVKRHGCPSHGIGLTPDEKQVWVCDGHNRRMHVFDVNTMPPKQVASIELRDQPGWITFSIDGRFAYPSTGDVIDVGSRRIITTLKDETGADVQSEKLLEVDFKDGKPLQAGNQFGVGRTSVKGNW